MPPPLIALEEHFLHPSVLSTPAIAQAYDGQLKHVPGLREKLENLSSDRISNMDASSISFQILSHAPTPGSPSAEQCREINDTLAEAVEAHPDRFAGFAVLPMSDPEAAATELIRCVKELKFIGALIDNHCHGTFFDGPAYLPFWRAAASLDVPIYIHPTWPSSTSTSLYAASDDSFSAAAAQSLGSSAFGWHSECAIHFLRLYASHLFDTFPNLKIVLGHFGEMLPFMLERVKQLSVRWGTFTRDYPTVYKENLWITTSGVWGLAPLGCMLMNTDINRILFSVDYPFARNEDGLKWIEELEKSGMVTKEQLEMIAYGNAEKLFGVKAPRR